MINLEEYYNPFSIKTILEGKEYTYGTYFDRIATPGYYLEAKPNTLMSDLEHKAKAKFKLENDPESYVQEVRISYFKMLDKFINNHGEPKDEKDECYMKNYIARGCLDELKDLAKKMKSNTYYLDTKLGEYIVQKLINIGDNDGKSTLSIETLEYEIHNKNESMTDCYNEFAEWFNNEKHNILTKKQIAYLGDPSIVTNKNKKTIEKNINKRIDQKYSNLSITECKEYNLNRKIKILNDILDCKDDKSMLKMIVDNIKTEMWFEDFIYDVNFDTITYISDYIDGFYYEDKPKIYNITNILVNKLNEISNYTLKN